MPPPPLSPIFFISEFLFALTAIIFCILIYSKTKEIYYLTKHEGIKFFRDAFLFLGCAYFLRFLFSLMSLSRAVFDIFIPGEAIAPIMMFTGYFSTVGLIYLLLSSMWKHLKEKNRNFLLILIHILSFAASIIAFITRSPHVFLIAQLILLLFILVVFFGSEDKLSKKLTRTRILYLLVASLWFINLFSAGRPIFSREIDISFQAIALIVFVTIYIRVSKWL